LQVYSNQSADPTIRELKKTLREKTKELELLRQENARLYEEMKRKAVQIETLLAVSRTISSNRYVNEILHLLVTMTAEMMNSKICSLMLLDEKKGELEIVATQSLSEEYRNKPNLKIGQSISGSAVSERRPIAVLDVTKEKGYMYPEGRPDGISTFILCRDNGQCCFGGQPKLTDMIKVKMADGRTAQFSDHMVSVAGIFRLRDLRKAGNLEPAFELEATHFGPAKTSY
jgi:hypothetical protein